MKKMTIIITVVICLLAFIVGVASAYNDYDKIAVRIKKVHDDAKPNKPISYNTALRYAKAIRKAASRYDNVTPELLASFAEVESNYVNHVRPWDRKGYSLGIWFMQENTAEWVWNEMGIEGDFNQWKVIIVDDLGAEFAAWYLNWLFKVNDNDIRKVAYAWNVGNSHGLNPDTTSYNHVIRVLGVYELYKMMKDI